MSPDLAPFFERRQRFTAAIGDAMAVIPGAGESPRNGDVHFEFRQASDFFFLTGFDEPDAVAVINPAHAKERYVLFVRPRDREMEIWNGRRAGVEGAIATYGADAAYPIDQLDAKLREYAVDRPRSTTAWATPRSTRRITRLVAELRAARSRGFTAPVRIEDPGPILHELRLRKTPAEMHADAPRVRDQPRRPTPRRCGTRSPGLHEYQVQAALEFVFRTHGSSRNAYPSIVASGAERLHPALRREHAAHGGRRAAADRRRLRVRLHGLRHHADVPGQRPLQRPAARRSTRSSCGRSQAGIAAAQPGVKYEVIHEAARRVLTEGLVGAEAAAAQRRRFAGHAPLSRVLHARHRPLARHGRARRRRLPDATARSRALEPGMVFTVEPGLYFDPERESVTFTLREYSEDEQWERRYRMGMAAAKKVEEEEKAKAQTITHPVPKEFRGIGIRVEDDILITTGGHENPDRRHPEDHRRGRAHVRGDLTTAEALT